MAASGATSRAASGATSRAASGATSRAASGATSRAGSRETSRAAVPDPSGSAAGRAYRWLLDAKIPRDTIARRALQALVGIDAAPVSTIHAFCADLLRRHPREAGVDPGFAIDRGESFDVLFDAAFERFLAAELGPAGARQALWRRVLAIPGAIGMVRDLARSLASFLLPAVTPGDPYRPADPARLFGGEIAALRARLERIPALPGLNRNLPDWIRRVDRLLAAGAGGGPAVLRLIATSHGLAGILSKDPPSAGARLSPADQAEVEDALDQAHHLLSILAEVDEEAVAALVEVAAPIALRAREALLEAGYVSFDALLGLTRDLLRDHPAIRRRCRDRLRAILVDEFQDTDPLQYEILFFLADESDPPATDPWKTRLAPGRLFIVGDAKQSIYRFRGADLDAWRRAVDHLSGGHPPLALTASFRSPAGLLRPINRLFDRWMNALPPASRALQAPYAAIEAARPGAETPGPRLEIWSVEAAGRADDRRRAEADVIAAWIADHHRDGAGDGERLGYGKVAILLRALTHAGLYTRALRQAAVPFVIDGGRDFYERHEVSDLVAFLRAVASPNDGPAVLAVLRSPVGAVPDADLARFAAAGGRFDRPDGGIDLAPHPAVRRALADLAAFRVAARHRPVDAIVRAALEETPIGLLHAATFDGAQRIANLRKLAAEAQDLARRGLSLEEMIDALEDEFRTDRSEGESPLADETVDAVRILSIHKAKGLEYPVVFVPDLGRIDSGGGPRPTRCARLREDGQEHLTVSLSAGVGNLAAARLRLLDERHAEAEERRVFYVACTRARERLILVNSSRETRPIPWRDGLEALGYTARGAFPAEGPISADVLHRRKVAVARRGDPRPPGTAAAWTRAIEAFETAAASAQSTARPAIRWPAGTTDERSTFATGDESGAPGPRVTRGAADRSAGSADADGGAGTAALVAGRAVHAALERWDFRDAAALRAMAEAATRPAAGEIRLAADPAATLARALREVGEILAGFLASDLPARLGRTTILGREVPVLFGGEEETVWSGACDLIYRDADGSVVVADYKTDAVSGDPREAADRYRPQMTVYREAVSRALPGATVRAEILFVRTGRTVRLDG
jgi:ATP-dependent helicase/nuclease subunit A